MWITLWITCGKSVENVKNAYFSRHKMWITYQQNTTCKIKNFVHIILLQEDSMSGGCVYNVRRDVLSKCFSIISQCRSNDSIIMYFYLSETFQMIDSIKKSKKRCSESYLLVSGDNRNISHVCLCSFIGIMVIYATATGILIGGNNNEYKQFSSIIYGIREI